MSSRAAELLARPFSLGRTTLPNRIVMAPMTRQFSPGGVPGEDVAAYYARRAANGVGLVITEGTTVDHPAASQSSRVPVFHGADALAGWARVAEAVHGAGGRIMPQLWHVGLARSADATSNPGEPAVGPSGVGADGQPLGRPLPPAEVDEVVRAFAEAAAAAERIGFDGVELHGAHGYLIDQFLWAGTNRRTDGYGGDPASRARFAAEIAAAVRAAVSPDFPVVFRLSQWKQQDYTARIAESPEELEVLLGRLVEAGVDAFHASTRRYWLPEFEGSDLNLAGWAKKLTGKPTVTVGSVGLDNDFLSTFAGQETAVAPSLDDLLDRLERDEFDLVAVGRALLADPEWAAKVLAGRDDSFVTYTAQMLKTLH